MSRLHITLSLVGFESHKARPDFSHPFGFWLRVSAADVTPFADAFKTSPTLFHNFRVEQQIGNQMRALTMTAQIVKIEEGPAEFLIQIRPDPAYGSQFQWA